MGAGASAIAATTLGARIAGGVHESGAAGAARGLTGRAWTGGADLVCGWFSTILVAGSEALRSAIAAAVRVVEAFERFAAKRLRMMASRDPPLWPPITTPTR